MSAKSQRGIHDNSPTKRYRSPRLVVKNRTAKQQHITYDYDAAISQPDVPNLLDYRKIGRGAMVSRVPIKKSALRTRLSGRIMSSKNFQKRSQEFRSKSLVQRHAKIRSPGGRNAIQMKNIIASSVIPEEEKRGDEKENVPVDVDDLSNFLRKNLIMNGKSMSMKEATKEAVKNDNRIENQMAGEKVINGRSENCESATMKSLVQVKGSKIPRAKIAVFPVHTLHEFHSEKKSPVNNKTRESRSKCPIINCIDENGEISEKEAKKRSRGKEESNSCKQDVVRFDELSNDTKTVWNREETSTLEADEEAEDFGLSSADESPAIISSIDDPRVLTILRSLKLNCPCKSCTGHDPHSSSRQEDDSELKSSPPEERKKKWSLKHRKYANTSSEDEVTSDFNSEASQKKRRSRLKSKSTLTRRIKTNSMVNASPKVSNRRRSNFSFFNTLFDIVFWPYLFLKTNR